MYKVLLDIDSIYGTTIVEDILKGVENVINKRSLQWENLKSTTTDGGKTCVVIMKEWSLLCKRL